MAKDVDEMVEDEPVVDDEIDTPGALDDDLDDELDDDALSSDDDEDDDDEDDTPATTKSKAKGDADDDDEDEPDPDDVEADLDAIFKATIAATDDDDDDDDEEDVVTPEPESPEGGGRIQPKRPGEFVCQSCFLVKHPSQLADEDHQLCLDCV